jgi:hypothetical protein
MKYRLKIAIAGLLEWFERHGRKSAAGQSSSVPGQAEEFPHSQDALADVFRRNRIFQPISQRELASLQNYIIVSGQGRIIIIGYGSFGGTTLAREIAREVSQEIANRRSNNSFVVLRLEMIDQSEDEYIFNVSTQRFDQDILVQQITTKAHEEASSRHHISGFLDVLTELMSGRRCRVRHRKSLMRAMSIKNIPSRLVMVIDKVVDLETLKLFVNHPLFEHKQVSSLVIVQREGYDRWDAGGKRVLEQRGFQVWNVPCLWESEYHLVEQAMDILFQGYSLDNPEKAKMYHAYKKYIAFKGRGALGTTMRELQRLTYWHFDEETGLPSVELESLDHELVLHRAWIQDTLEANWESILGNDFIGRQPTDRAKQGVYALTDWIIRCSRFTLGEILEAAAGSSIIVSPHKRLRDTVALRLLGVLVDNAYLQRMETEQGIMWARDITESDQELLRSDTSIGDPVPWSEQLDTLGRYRKSLLADHKAAYDQLSASVSQVERNRLKRQIDKLEQELEQVENELNSLQGSATLYMEKESPEDD